MVRRKAKIIELPAKGEQPVVAETGVIGVGEEIQPADVIRLAHRSKLSHVVQKNGLAFDRELAVSRTMSENLDSFLKEPLDIILGLASETEPARETLHLADLAWDKKADSLDQISEFIGKVKGARRIREQAMMVADELFTNAVKVGQPHSVIAPGAPQREGSVEFFASADDSRLVLGCRDSYGELSFATILARLTQCFETGIVQSIKQGNSGAGIGSFLVFNTCVSYYCGVKKDHVTVVCVALPLGVSDDELATFPKNIHLVSA